MSSNLRIHASINSLVTYKLKGFKAFLTRHAQLKAAHAWGLEIALVRTSICVCVCVSAPEALITSGVIWCDIGCVRLVKQVSWHFPAFNYFI